MNAFHYSLVLVGHVKLVTQIGQNYFRQLLMIWELPSQRQLIFIGLRNTIPTLLDRPNSASESMNV